MEIDKEVRRRDQINIPIYRGLGRSKAELTA